LIGRPALAGDRLRDHRCRGLRVGRRRRPLNIDPRGAARPGADPAPVVPRHPAHSLRRHARRALCPEALTRYYAYDRDTQAVEKLWDTRPQLLAYTLAPKQAVVIKARDGRRRSLEFPISGKTAVLHAGLAALIARESARRHRGRRCWAARQGD